MRELENVVERALIINSAGNALPDNLDEMTVMHIQKVLNKAGGKIHGSDGAAQLLGVNASTLRNRMNKLGIEYRKRN